MRSLARTQAGRATGAIDGNWHQILNQTAGACIGWLLSIAGTLVLLFVVDKVMGLRVAPDQEVAASISQHGEEGYEFNA